MFLFKNTKSLAKRIVMNIAVYGWIGVFVTMLLTIILPDNFSEIIRYFLFISSFSALIGTVVSIVWPIVEFFIYIFSGSKDLSKPGTDVEKQNKKKTSSTLTKEVVVFSRPLNSCTGKIEPTDFIIRIFPDKVEILWGVGWRGGISHADGAGDVEILDADYFEKHTIDDFITLLEATHWGKDFVKWFDIKNNEKITNLFAEYTISYQEGRFRQLAPKYKLLFCLNKENDELSKLLNGKVRKKYEDMYAVYIDSENGTCILSHAILIQLGAASTDEVVYAKVISFDEMKHLLSYEIDCLKSLAAKQKNDGIHNESIELRCKEIEKIINASPADLRKIIFEENGNEYTCERCKKVISESESALTDNHRFCKKCASPAQNSDKHLKDKVSDAVYQARMDFERGGSPSFESSLGNRGMFTCSNCHNVLPQKYLHSNGICASCAAEVTQPSRKVEEVFYKAIGKCSNCGEALSMSHQNDSLCISCEWAQDKSSDNREIFKMRTNDNRYLDFSYSGHSRYSPNHSSSNGYGSDDWMYLCEKNGTRFLLMFSDNAEYGTGWMYTELLIGDSERLIKENADYWISIAHSKERTKTYLIHLTEIDSVRHLLPTSSRCQSKLTDEHYLR